MVDEFCSERQPDGVDVSLHGAAGDLEERTGREGEEGHVCWEGRDGNDESIYRLFRIEVRAGRLEQNGEGLEMAYICSRRVRRPLKH